MTIGIDELFVTRRKGLEKYITVVWDLESGAVLFLSRGKGADRLKKHMIGNNRLMAVLQDFQMSPMEGFNNKIRWLMGRPTVTGTMKTFT